MGKNKRYKRKAKRLFGHCCNTKCCNCNDFITHDFYHWTTGEVDRYEVCRFGYEGEGVRWLENHFKCIPIESFFESNE
ncbi:hypothetical protein ACSXEK_15760 (plasmid) [Clostridium perfringens]|uniref:hypothetical protein n=1 Tax=Clostridium perfringens TaxID=1502 RepID=UPI0024BC4CDB|nr:hypothetical protein [Clostridium perfringens]